MSGWGDCINYRSYKVVCNLKLELFNGNCL